MTKDAVIQNLKELSKEVKKPTLVLEDIRKIPKLEYYLYVHFENLADALNESGLASSQLAKKMATSDEDLLQYLWNLSLSKKRRPTSRDINKDGKYHYKIFTRRFDTLEKAYNEAKEKFEATNLHVALADNVNISEEVNLEIITPIKEFEFKGQFYGVAAENLVVSELLYRGYEAYLINVDLGLDVMAYKDGKVFYFQVKNISFDKSNTRSIPITKSSYIRNKSNNVYYFFIMQTEFTRDYVIIPQLKLLEYEERGLITPEGEENMGLSFKKDGKTYSLAFEKIDEKLEAYTNHRAWRYLI